MAFLLGTRSYHRRWCKCLLLTCGLLLLVLWTSFASAGDDSHAGSAFKAPAWETLGKSRRLQSVLPNCTPPAIEQFPRDLFSPEQRRSGFLVTHILIAAYMFLALAIACDDYFVPSLEAICDILNLQTDVAGATFMAAGSSAPELATAIIAVFIAQDDIGLGTVVGSAVYNVTFVIGVCALFAGMVLHLNWWPLVRDCAFYALSVISLVLIILDETVCWYEALALILLYILYILLMCYNPQLEAWAHSKLKCGAVLEEEITVYEKISTKPSSGAISLTTVGTSSGEGPDGQSKKEMPREESQFVSPLSLPEGCCRRALWVISLPITLLLFLTIPDCRRTACRKWFTMTFIMSLVWLSVFSYLMIWMITIIGHTLGIPDTVMGLTFIAFGVSVPDAISSLIVVREGYGDMGVSNAVGSNIFDILVCLGIPWLLETTVHNPGSTVQVYSQGLTYSSITLLSTVAFLIIATHLNGWKLNKSYGVLLMVVYLLFMVLASLYELNIFGYFHPVECGTDF
ncbi:probable sodium/potassium/calcium exchanger CG1090 isoform X2 [Liolophura sinensis]|uniref:probable sodium/potassium/calcium exchanger CG1090 isoform X2 n=1 Tax=Liolophura sinensis TaxID=3198878 RepID=UPI003158F64D